MGVEIGHETVDMKNKLRSQSASTEWYEKITQRYDATYEILKHEKLKDLPS